MIKKEINKKNVEDFLLKNPDFFLSNPKILTKLSFPFATKKNFSDENVISYEDWVIKSLKKKQKNIIDNAKYNFFTQKKILEAVIELLKKKKIEDFLYFLREKLPEFFELEIINFATSKSLITEKYNFILMEENNVLSIHNINDVLIMDAVDKDMGIFNDVKSKIYSNAVFSFDSEIFNTPSLLIYGSKGKHFLDNKAYDLILFFSKFVEEKLRQLI